MDARPFFARQVDQSRGPDGCLLNCPAPLPCSPCQTGEVCARINRGCDDCGVTKCVPDGSHQPSGKGGVSKGALAGGVVGAILFFALSIALFLRYRKRSLMRKPPAQREVKDVPAPAETVLNRPDPIEKPPSEYNTIQVYPPTTALDLSQTSSHAHTPLNPFDDANSIQTTGTEGTNVIPIALISPDSHRASVTRSDSPHPPGSPTRPVRSPDLNLNLDHVNVSRDNLRPVAAGSTISGISGISRNSYLSSASFSSEFLNEAPMIMTPTKGAVRQVVGVVKAEVISTGPGSPDLLKPPAYGKPSVASPLASTVFGADETVTDGEGNRDTIDPFADENASNHASYAASPAPTATTFGGKVRESDASKWVPDGPQLPPSAWGSRNLTEQSRPSSLSTQAGSVIDIASATRVNVGLKTPGSGNSHRTTMGRLVSPGSGLGTLQQQQQRALAHAQAQAQAQGLDARRVSGSSAISAASTHADSILESFPFVPPSPISDRPVRSPPVSPLSKQSFTSNSSPLHQHTFVVAPPSPLTQPTFSTDASQTGYETDSTKNTDSILAPPSRRMLGLSTGSQLSTASSGLGSFPFQIESEPTGDHAPPTAYNGRQRASLDTLALTNDLSSYPLGFDRDSVQTFKK